MRDAATGGLVERAIVEAIDSLAVPKVRNAVVELALRWGRFSHIPERGPDVEEFVKGALFAAAEQVLGQPAAESLEAQLMPVAVMVRNQEVSGVRSSTPPNGVSDFPEISFAPPARATPLPPDARPPFVTDPAPAHLPSIAVASQDPGGVSQMSKTLAGTAMVHPVRDALAILDELGHRETDLVVIDCRRPVVSVETLLALGPELPDEARIVLWGERADLEESLQFLGIELPDNWVCCGPHASADDVGAVCRILLE